MSAVSVRGLRRSFAGTPVLEGVDLDVPEGAVTAVLGPSGCGKTTLLRIVAGFLAPDAGTVRLDGELVVGPGVNRPTPRRKVGYVAQEGALFPHLDVAANIGFGLPRRERRARSQIEELLTVVGLDPALARRYPHELSGGQQQRVAVARALAPRPPVVLLDEPFSSLDAGLREETGRAVVEALRTAGATTVLVTHDQDEALSLADELAVMRAGRFVQTGTPRVIYERPVDRSVAEFVGAAVILDATVRHGVAHCALGVLAVADHGAVTGETADGTGGNGRAAILVRPEQIRLSPAEPSGLCAMVDSVDYHGHDATVRLLLLPDHDVVQARVAGHDVPELGALVAVQVHGPARCLGG